MIEVPFLEKRMLNIINEISINLVFVKQVFALYKIGSMEIIEYKNF